MKIFKETAKLKEELRALKGRKQEIGFVPTMGALHDGHLSLVQKCKEENSICVVSIFVNPLQFNNSEDFDNYPHQLEQDKMLLENAACDILFVPTEAGLNAANDVFDYSLGSMENTMEGLYRPGHLKGMLTIVKRFLDLLEPNKAYFGEKDFQQLSAVKKMVKDLDLKVEVIGVPTKREANGLAMSSRNLLLSDSEKDEAAALYQTLSYARRNSDRLSPLQLKMKCQNMLEDKNLKWEYFEIADSKSLQSIDEWEDSNSPRAFVAAYLGKIRLIDNMSLIE